jgi:hypothetical protein
MFGICSSIFREEDRSKQTGNKKKEVPPASHCLIL